MKFLLVISKRVFVFFYFSTAVHLSPLVAEELHWSGDSRMGYYAKERNKRDGINSSRDEGACTAPFWC